MNFVRAPLTTAALGSLLIGLAAPAHAAVLPTITDSLSWSINNAATSSQGNGPSTSPYMDQKAVTNISPAPPAGAGALAGGDPGSGRFLVGSGGAENFYAHGSVTYETTYTSTFNVPTIINMNYHINRGFMEVAVDSQSLGTASAAITALIAVNSITMAGAGVTLGLTGPFASATLNKNGLLGPPNNNVTYSTHAGYGYFTWDAIDGVIPISVLPNATITVDYTMATTASGTHPLTNGCFGHSGQFCGSNHAFGWIGDPVSFDAPSVDLSGLSPLLSFSTSSSIPEPVSATLLFVSIAGLNLARRRRQRASVETGIPAG